MKISTTAGQQETAIMVGSLLLLDPTASNPTLKKSESSLENGYVITYSSAQVSQYSFPLNDFSIGEIQWDKPLELDYVKIQQGKEYYRKNKSKILEEYAGKYVAIIEETVVDFDTVFSDLAKRVYDKYGYHSIYMPLIQVEQRKLRIPSPKLKST